MTHEGLQAQYEQALARADASGLDVEADGYAKTALTTGSRPTRYSPTAIGAA